MMNNQSQPMPQLTMLVGFPGSGKSTVAQGMVEESPGTIIVSSDAMRKELFGDENCQNHNDLLFKQLHKRIRDHLQDGNDVIYDACNINYKQRMEFLKSLNSIPCWKRVLVVATPVSECLRRNANRERVVPEKAIFKMYRNFWMPASYEGFNSVTVYRPILKKQKTADEFVKMVFAWDQMNSHHSRTLGEHMALARDAILKEDPFNSILAYAAYIHDCGKPFCATRKNAKDVLDGEMHYYGHEHAGAYSSMFFVDNPDPVRVAQLIQWHMRPYTAWEQSEKAREKDLRLLGETLYREILALHKADLFAH